MKPGYNNQDRGALWRQVAVSKPDANTLPRGCIGRLWGGKAGRLALPDLRTRNRLAFGRLRLLQTGVFGLLRRRGFSLSPERYLRRPLSSPLQVTLTRNGAAAIHYGGSLLRPLSVVNNNTSRHKTSRYQQINQQFTRQWHDCRRLNLVSYIGLATPVLHGVAVLHFRQVQRALLRLAGHTQTANGIFTNRTERFWINGDKPVVAGLAPAVMGLVTAARLTARTLYNNTLSGRIDRAGLPSTSPSISGPAGVDFSGRDSRQDTPRSLRAVSHRFSDLPLLQAVNRDLRRQGGWQAAPLLRISRLSLPIRLLTRVARMQRRGERWQSTVVGLHDTGDNQSWLSSFSELSPLHLQPLHRQLASPAVNVSSTAAAARRRALQNITHRPALSRNRETLPDTHSGFILAARDRAGLSGLVVAMRGLSRNAAGTSTGIVMRRNLPGVLSPRGQLSVTLSEQAQFIRRQQMRAQHAIAELCRNQEQQRQHVQQRDERIITELRQQLQALQRSNSNEQAALLKAVQSLERALTQTLKTTPASALRPLSFMGNR